MYTKKNVIAIICLFFTVALYGYIIPDDSLQIKLENIKHIYMSDIDEAFEKSSDLIFEARSLKDIKVELQLLELRCKYYYSKKNLDGLYNEARTLKKKGKHVNDLYYICMSNIFLTEVHSINKLPEKALPYLHENLALLKDADIKEARNFFSKVNTLTSFANIYNDMGDHRQAAYYILKIINSYEGLKDKKGIKKYQYVNYSNLASTYYHLDVDSARYYAEKSMSLFENDLKDKIYISNLIILGNVNKVQNNDDTALRFFEQALELSETIGESLNIEELYINLIEVYEKQGKPEKAHLIKEKLLAFQMQHLKSQNDVLQKIISENDQEKKVNLWIYVIVILAPVALFTVIYVIILKRRIHNNILTVAATEEMPTYEDLLNILKGNESEFLPAFEKVYPNFRVSLLNRNPYLGNTEIEFCALIKMNLSTKEIAQIKFIEIRTVQNKKYRIRKKLGIPQSEDLYNWIVLNT